MNDWRKNQDLLPADSSYQNPGWEQAEITPIKKSQSRTTFQAENSDNNSRVKKNSFSGDPSEPGGKTPLPVLAN